MAVLILTLFSGLLFSESAPAGSNPSNRKQLNSIALDRIRLAGKNLAEASIDSGELRAKNSEGKELGGQDLLGALLSGIDYSGKEFKLRISAIASDAEQTALPLYQFDFFKNSDQSWKSVCLPDTQGQTRAFLLPGNYDPSGVFKASCTRFSLACTISAAAKCIRWGYPPWESRDGVKLWDYHQACTRMVRADYLGNGETHTHDGIQIFFVDTLGINSGPPPQGMQFEAAWGPLGAVYAARTRLASKSDPLLRIGREKGKILLLNFSFPPPS